MLNKYILGIIAIIILLGALVYTQKMTQPNGSLQNSQTVSNTDDAAVRKVVTEFGSKLQMVSLLASTQNRKTAMQEHYADYVAPTLLQKWFPEGAEALGRYTSSPSPDRIEIIETKQVDEHFVVEGNVIEVTNTEVGQPKEAAAVYPVTLTLEKINNKWLIVEAKKGAYSELPQRRTIVGYWECLPHKNTSGPQTMECAFGIAIDQSDGHYAVNTQLMSTYPVDFPTGTKVRVTGVVTPVTHLSSPQKYDIDGIISATTIEKI